MWRLVHSHPILTRIGLGGVILALAGQVAHLFSEVYIVYNGILVLALMMLVVGIGQWRKKQIGARADDRRLPMYWPALLILAFAFMGTAESIDTFKVVRIAIS